MRPLDTSPEAYRVQVNIFRKMSPEERLQRGIELAQMCRKLMAEGVRMRHPDYGEEEIHHAVIRLQLGDELFEKVYPKFRHLRP